MDFIQIDGEGYYKISNIDSLRPFFMSIVSDSNHWMFIASNGGLTAGRKNNSFSLFPYYSDDKITESYENTGSKTIFKVQQAGGFKIWEPFSDKYTGVYHISRNLYKNEYGNKIIFEEINHDLNLSFQYSWRSSDKFGFVKTSRLLNDSSARQELELIDGFQNLMPYGVDPDLQQTTSNLIDAYKKSELIEDSKLGVFSLSAIIIDKAEPSEALKTNIAWSIGLDEPLVLLSTLQLQKFKKGNQLKQENDIRAEKGAYLVHSNLNLEAGQSTNWYIIADVKKGPSEVVNISEQIKNKQNLSRAVEEDISHGTQALMKLTFAADGSQLTSDHRKDTRHFANVMFNIMRGGIFDQNYTLEKGDFLTYLAKANKLLPFRMKKELNHLDELFSLKELKQISERSENHNFKRLALEYLPLKFSRRHGDPSRPWNKFSINTKSELDGSKILDYQGNWRDIFQNWEALAHSYPSFIQGMIYKFLNASTFDGYNPYRVTKDGFDWEVIEPDDPWSYIGYWGDHQLIYLLKFLEFSENHFKGGLTKLFTEEIFTYANVPYRIKSYSAILKNPKDTIEFDESEDKKIRARRAEIGADGALLTCASGEIYQVNLLEKILGTLLAKTSNLIPEGGIWMNTQRPEWNDANNALVGNGVSMVTLYYMRRFVAFFYDQLNQSNFDAIPVSIEMKGFFESILAALIQHRECLEAQISDTKRKEIMDGLGQPASAYRQDIYSKGFQGKKTSINRSELLRYCEIALAFLNHSIRANKRADHLYHAYNLMSLVGENEVKIDRLSEMLEGQVAVLSSGYLSALDSLNLLDSLRKSKLYREDQHTYLLYPNKELPIFIARNLVSEDAVNRSKLLQELLKNQNLEVIEQDAKGDYHFNGNFNNVQSLTEALHKLGEEYQGLAKEEEELLKEIFEEVFNHKAFTGRSGTFYGYEGLGSIYWHMVSKLALAVQETYFKAIDSNESVEVINQLKDYYYEITAGIGIHKDPELYGAFPTDPYSHTPLGKGAQQPGMTGQVKEDILTRFGELGVRIGNNELRFETDLLDRSEFLSEPKKFKYESTDSQSHELLLQKGQLAFSYCQTPIVYSRGEQKGIEVQMMNGELIKNTSHSLGEELSQKLFQRTGEIQTIKVTIQA